VQTVIIALIQALVVALFLEGTTAGNGMVVLGIGLVCLVFMLITLWSGIKAVWNSFNRLFGAFNQAAGGTILTPAQAGSAAATAGLVAGGAVAIGSSSLAGMMAMDMGAQFTLTMNTGAVLRYEFGEVRQVRRGETSSFRQVSPGLALVLIGETDADGLPTATRTLVMATYSPDQELEREGLLTTALALPTPFPTLPIPTATPIPFARLDVQLIAVTTLDGQVTTRLRLYNAGGETLRFTPDDIWMAFGYAEKPPGPRIPAEGMTPIDLLPGQAADITLVWLWAGEPYGSLGVGGWLFAINF
jgi:hypothetical protein